MFIDTNKVIYEYKPDLAGPNQKNMMTQSTATCLPMHWLDSREVPARHGDHDVCPLSKVIIPKHYFRFFFKQHNFYLLLLFQITKDCILMCLTKVKQRIG